MYFSCLLLLHSLFAATTSQSVISEFNVIQGVSIQSSHSSIAAFSNVDVYTCATKCMWSPSCGAFNFFINPLSGLTTCELRISISGAKFLSSMVRNTSVNFYYKKCPPSFKNYNAQYKTYYYVYAPYVDSGVTANLFCANAGLQLLQNRNFGEIQYIWENVYQGHIWLNAQTWDGNAGIWRNDGDMVDFSAASPGGNRCPYAAGKECISSSSNFASKWCADTCTYGYPAIICTCYDYDKVISKK